MHPGIRDARSAGRTPEEVSNSKFADSIILAPYMAGWSRINPPAQRASKATAVVPPRLEWLLAVEVQRMSDRM